MTSDRLWNLIRVRLQEILTLKRRLIELIAQLEANEFGFAATDPAGALDGDGSVGDPLAVRVDGVTITINGSNQLETASVTGETNVAPFGALDGDGTVGDPLAVRVDGQTVIINDDNQLTALPPPATNVPTNNTFLVAGGQVVWVSAYTFIVSAAVYYINGVLFESPQTLIALSAADPTDDRIDVFVLDDAGLVDVVEGTPSAQPAEPDVDPATQLKLAIVIVAAASSQPGGSTSVTVYAENAGGPGEWNWSTSGSGWNLASTNNPRSGSIDIEATNVASGAYLQAQIASGTFDPNAYEFLVLYIRSKATWANNRILLIRLQNAGVVVGSTLTIAHGTYGFNSSNTTDYQQIAIPLSFFSVPAGQVITQIRILRQGPSTIGFYIDDVSFTGSGTSVPGGGLTQEQADARYAPLGPRYVVTAADPTLTNERVITAGDGIAITDNGPGSTLVIEATGDGGSPSSPENILDGTEYPIKFTLDGQGADIATGAKNYTALIPPVGYDGMLIAWNLYSPQTGDIVINVLKNGVSITDGNDPELSGSDEEDDVDLSDWDDQTVAGGDRLSIDVLSCSGIEFAELQLIVVRT